MIANDKIDVLVLVPVDATYANVIVDYAHEHGVKVIAYSRPIENSKIDFHIKFDVPAIGEQQAQYAVDKVKVGNYLIIQGPKQDLNTQLLLDGQMEVLQPKIDRNEIDLVDTVYLSGWSKLKAVDSVKTAFTSTRKNYRRCHFCKRYDCGSSLRIRKRAWINRCFNYWARCRCESLFAYRRE
jgi:D-xylose transport system substrate-binding protein